MVSLETLLAGLIGSWSNCVILLHFLVFRPVDTVGMGTVTDPTSGLGWLDQVDGKMDGMGWRSGEGAWAESILMIGRVVWCRQDLLVWRCQICQCLQTQIPFPSR